MPRHADEEHDSDIVVSAPALARTYNPPGYHDPWACVHDYWRVLEYAGTNPGKGSGAIANALSLPRGRIRPWLNGAAPDVVWAVELAESRDWLPLRITDHLFRGMNLLVAWIYSGGSIQEETYVPYFAIRDQTDRDLLEDAAKLIGIRLSETRERDETRAIELRPSQDASVLGRGLSVLGAPVGPKNTEHPRDLPAYLTEAPQACRRGFCWIYVHNRGQSHDRKATVTVNEERALTYLDQLAQLIHRETNEPVTASPGTVTISAAAMREIDNWQHPLTDHP